MSRLSTIRMLTLSLGLTTWAVAGGAGCSGGPEVEVVASVGDIEQDAPVVGRQSARMIVNQLKQSIGVAAGKDKNGAPITWTYSTDNNDFPIFEALGSTLGDPNYIRITEEPAIPNALYVKFAQDIARNVCRQMKEADATLAEKSNRVLTRFIAKDEMVNASEIASNLDYLHLRFFGERIGERDEAAVAALSEIFHTAAGESQKAGVPTGSTAALEGWQAVCIAMLTSPSFHIY